MSKGTPSGPLTPTNTATPSLDVLKYFEITVISLAAAMVLAAFGLVIYVAGLRAKLTYTSHVGHYPEASLREIENALQIEAQRLPGPWGPRLRAFLARPWGIMIRTLGALRLRWPFSNGTMRETIALQQVAPPVPTEEVPPIPDEEVPPMPEEERSEEVVEEEVVEEEEGNSPLMGPKTIEELLEEEGQAWGRRA
ncbi:hypothetical protein BO70DRAFT_351272 [Aspergillus heteromorphus CBS 117.55]|uniref:Uncharacterized protein n=1 Tax=Aspergillus heteromorphus CBS 117.55 TaxID=1448321 RepID=A0A317WN18_9EURO|nr:uncharacterized protein BO70DRAFT_351272 [Aspergillus heteromorphus CBS 117.55]PWY86672.1 hypothetical protein BO70DRAFT_351272 [Aspergillus heteromorphus CBS 117.55]